VDAYFNFMNHKRIEADKARQEEMEAEDSGAAEEAPEVPAEETAEAEEVPAEDENSGIDYSANRFGLKYIEITKARMIGDSGKDGRIFRAGEKVTIEMDYKVNSPLDEYIFGFGFYTLEGECLYGNNTQLDRMTVKTDKTSGTVAVDVLGLPLLAGKYVLNVAVVDNNGTPMDFYRNYCDFEVVSDDRSTGYFSIPHNWRITK